MSKSPTPPERLDYYAQVVKGFFDSEHLDPSVEEITERVHSGGGYSGKLERHFYERMGDALKGIRKRLMADSFGGLEVCLLSRHYYKRDGLRDRIKRGDLDPNSPEDMDLVDVSIAGHGRTEAAGIKLKEKNGPDWVFFAVSVRDHRLWAGKTSRLLLTNKDGLLTGEMLEAIRDALYVKAVNCGIDLKSFNSWIQNIANGIGDQNQERQHAAIEQA